MKLKSLYKIDAKGNMLGWRIWTIGCTVYTRHGRLDGNVQQDEYEILEGVNIGKSNHRDRDEQADFEAEAKWKKQIKYKGYFETQAEAQKAGDNTPFGALKPMKAQRYDKHGHKLTYPLYVQPKLNGLRCIAVRLDHEVKLYRSGGQEIKHLQHINEEIMILLKPGEIVDGEIYCHGMPLEKISGIVRAEVNIKPKKELEQMEYWIFDAPLINIYDGPMYNTNHPFSLRSETLLIRFSYKTDFKYIKEVETNVAVDEEIAYAYYVKFVNNGFEGMMYRQLNGVYKPGKRSYEIQKRKDFKDDDFEILEANEGKGRAVGMAISFTCRLPNGGTVDVPMNGTNEYKIELWNNHEMWQDKWLQVRFLEYTSKGSLEIPKGLQIRDRKGLD